METVIAKWALLKAVESIGDDTQKSTLLAALPALKASTWLLDDEGTYTAIVSLLQPTLPSVE
jgi:hypothetical protein